MSQIKTTEIEGDVCISRHTAIGGNAVVQGNTTVQKSLKVKGWLDAPNIKGPNKGIFSTESELREAYPQPRNGWWALVGNTLPAPLFIVKNNDWVPTGQTAGNPTIDGEQYQDALTESVSDLNRKVLDIKESKGQPNGLAPLDAAAMVPEVNLPLSSFGVMQFSGMVNGVTVQDSTSDKGYKFAGCTVVYDTAINRFLLEVTDGDNKTYYRNWSNSGRHGRPDPDNGSVIPYSDKIFIHPNGGGLAYVWTGTTLEQIALNSTLASLRGLVDNLKESIGALGIADSNLITDLTKKADIDDSGHVPLAQTPDDALDTVEFAYFSRIEQNEIEGATLKASTDPGAKVVYSTVVNKFLLRYVVNGEVMPHYYSKWADAARFGVDALKRGATPHSHKTYFCTVNLTEDEAGANGEELPPEFGRAYYRWNGHQLCRVQPQSPVCLSFAYTTQAKVNGVEQYKLGQVSKYDNGTPILSESLSPAWPDRYVVYVSDRKRFMLWLPGYDGGKSQLWPVWPGYEEYGTLDDSKDNCGVVPHAYKIYHNCGDGSLWQWDGEKLATPLSAYEVRKELLAAMLEVAGTYSEAINSLRARLDALEERFTGGVLLL